MANPKHLAKLKEGVEAWNRWRKENPDVRPNLREADLIGRDLEHANLNGACLDFADLGRSSLNKANLRGALLRNAGFKEASLIEADLTEAKLKGARFREASLDEARLSRADLCEASFLGANLSDTVMIKAILSRADASHAYLDRANLSGAILKGTRLVGSIIDDANLSRANLSGAILERVHLCGANLTDAVLRDTDFNEANLADAVLQGADLHGANLHRASLIRTNLENANLTDCNVYGVSVWDIRLAGAIQSNLMISPDRESAIQVDNLEVAQFVYLLLNNEKIRQVIDTITSTVVLILGRFTKKRKPVLDSIRDELRRRDYLPVLFDFQKPNSKDLTGTVATLANMARFIIADLTDPSSVAHELATIAPNTVVPIQAILLAGQREYAMFPDLKRRHHWVLEPYQYQSERSLLKHLNNEVIAPAEAKVKELRDGR